MKSLFNPSSDREEYCALLAPPYGYETDFAIGTTYSLDIEALVGASISLGLSESIDNDICENPIYLLEAFQKTSEKVLVFCEKGQIKVPYQVTPLYMLLENMVSEVALKKDKSFHPKVWIVKYADDNGHKLYRCIVMSRNLTFDRSWDIVVALEGELTSENIETSKSLFDFVGFLNKNLDIRYMSDDKKSAYNRFRREIPKVEFKVLDKRFTDFEFIPLGIKGYDAKNTNLFRTYHEVVIISPFLSKSIIREFNGNMLSHRDTQTLITRKSELYKLEADDVSEFDVYALKDTIFDGEDAISESGVSDHLLDQIQKQDIHAKLYLMTKYSDSDLYLGSANASQNAFYGNIEFLLKLKGKRRYLNVDLLKEDLLGSDEVTSPFESVEVNGVNDDETDKRIDLEKTLKILCRLRCFGEVQGNEEKYTIELKFENVDQIEKEFNISIKPLFSIKKEKVTSNVLFESLDLLHLSEFFIVEVLYGNEKLSRLLKIRLEGMPEKREQSLVKQIIKTRDHFVQYLTFLLEGDYVLGSLMNKHHKTDVKALGLDYQLPNVYEKLLKASVHNPRKLKDIDRLLIMLEDGEMVPSGFKEMFETFKEVVTY